MLEVLDLLLIQRAQELRDTAETNCLENVAVVEDGSDSVRTWRLTAVKPGCFTRDRPDAMDHVKRIGSGSLSAYSQMLLRSSAGRSRSSVLGGVAFPVMLDVSGVFGAVAVVVMVGVSEVNDLACIGLESAFPCRYAIGEDRIVVVVEYRSVRESGRVQKSNLCLNKQTSRAREHLGSVLCFSFTAYAVHSPAAGFNHRRHYSRRTSRRHPQSQPTPMAPHPPSAPQPPF